MYCQGWLESVEENTVQRMWLQQDGAPPHYARLVRDFLKNLTYQRRWIGRGGHIAWPPRSPDLTSLDFFLWGYLKNIVYQTAPTTAEDLKDRIRRACRSISANVLRKTVDAFEKNDYNYVSNRMVVHLSICCRPKINIQCDFNVTL